MRVFFSFLFLSFSPEYCSFPITVELTVLGFAEFDMDFTAVRILRNFASGTGYPGREPSRRLPTRITPCLKPGQIKFMIPMAHHIKRPNPTQRTAQCSIVQAPPDLNEVGNDSLPLYSTYSRILNPVIAIPSL